MQSAISLSAFDPAKIEDFYQPQTWIDLNPALHILSAERMRQIAPVGVDEPMIAAQEQLLQREGYVHLPNLDWGLSLSDMSQAVVQLVDRGFVPPFCFMYDEFWLMFFKMHLILSRFLGPGYLMLPDFWAWHVDPRSSQSGWKPHRDKNRHALLPDGRPKSLSVWIPLTEATPLNGCIYIVPADRDPVYNTEREEEIRFELQDIRALPGPAGSFFCWNQALMHWGARASPRAPAARISMSFEFQRGDVPPMNQPILRPLTVLTMEQRLYLICQQVFQFQHMYPLSPDMKKFADAVMDRTRRARDAARAAQSPAGTPA